MRNLSIAAVLGLALILADTTASTAQELAEMGAEFKHAARMLDLEIEEYGKARERERQDLAELRRVNALFDKAIADPNTSRDDLVRLERQIDSAREIAIESTRACDDARQRMFEAMRKVAEMIRRFEDAGLALTPGAGDLQGTWRLSGSNGVTGLMVLTPNGSLLSGSYRLSNGRQGSLRGTSAGGTIELQLVDSEEGVVGNIEGALDVEHGEIIGTWQRMELSAGQPTAGEWTATRVSAEDVLER